jgi:endonuclease YncB( thermonuclease family)
MNFKITIITLFASLFATSVTAADIVGRASVVDGDTLEIHGIRIRMQGIDAPESSQTCEKYGKPYRCGQQAANFLDDLIASRPVRCKEETKDKYGRSVARCFIGNTDLNGEMVENGWAMAYRQYSTLYVANEERAKAGKNGIWNGTFQVPSEFRKAKKNGVRPMAMPAVTEKSKTAAASSECRIKGNINARGEHIFHAPGARFYDNTGIDTNKGERWFCSEPEATAAGWRAAH